MTETGCASAARGRNGCARLFPPVGFANIPRGTKKPRGAVLQLRLRAFGCGHGSPDHVPSHRGHEGHGLGARKEDIDMATIGTFKKSANGEFVGDIVTLSVQAKGVRIVPDRNPPSENAPTHRAFVGNAEVGAAWAKQSNEGRAYLGIKLDDPSLSAPVYANLFEDEGGETFSLIWSRSNRRTGD
jgi:uncharacterized protein (DUF736 family)